MAQRFDTDGGTAFQGYLAIVGEDGEVLARIDGAAIAALEDLDLDALGAGYVQADINARLDDIEEAINDIIAALQPA